MPDGRTRRIMSPETLAKLAESRKKSRVGIHEFMTAYLEGDSLRGIATTLGITVQSVKARVKTMRKAGINVPDRVLGGTGRRGGTRAGYSALTVAQLNKLIEGAKNGTLSISAAGVAMVGGEAITPESDDADSYL